MLSGMVKEEEKEALRTDLIGLATEYTPISIIGSGGNINKLFRLADKKDKKASLLPIESLQDIYETLKKHGAEVVIDDRDERAGVKFKDADLIGFPYQIIVGKSIAEGNVEFKTRASDEKTAMKPEEAAEMVITAINNIKK